MKILIVDGNNLQHRAMHAYAGLTNNVKPVSIVYGMILLTQYMLRQFKPYKVYVCWDTARHAERIKLHPEYKKTKSRKKHRSMVDYSVINTQREVVMSLYHSLNVHQLVGPGMEADDWIYMLTREHPNDYITIVSSDKDFNQLLSNKIKIWNPHKNLLIGKHNVKAHFGYSEKECIDYLSLVGDEGDNIKGYRGMGEESTKIFLAEHGSIRSFLEDESLVFKKLDRAKLKEVYKRNRLLIGLKAFYLKHLKDTPLSFYSNSKRVPSYRYEVVKKVCAEYNIKTFLKPDFLTPFKKLGHGKNIK